MAGSLGFESVSMTAAKMVVALVKKMVALTVSNWVDLSVKKAVE
jgi:hypothetical protein